MGELSKRGERRVIGNTVGCREGFLGEMEEVGGTPGGLKRKAAKCTSIGTVGLVKFGLGFVRAWSRI